MCCVMGGSDRSRFMDRLLGNNVFWDLKNLTFEYSLQSLF